MKNTLTHSIPRVQPPHLTRRAGVPTLAVHDHTLPGTQGSNESSHQETRLM